MEQAAKETTVSQPSQRILSVDVLRGFDMFWIVGGIGFAASIFSFCRSTVERTLRPQLEHVVWEGFHFCDLIFRKRPAEHVLLAVVPWIRPTTKPEEVRHGRVRQVETGRDARVLGRGHPALGRERSPSSGIL